LFDYRVLRRNQNCAVSRRLIKNKMSHFSHSMKRNCKTHQVSSVVM
jgi:hypothetical protein